MRVLVQGLWHLGSVTAACLARAGHDVIGLDRDAATIATLKTGQAPISEPGLDELLRAHPFELTTEVAAAARADVAWVTYDTPVDADDTADVDFVITEVAAMLPHLRAGAVVLVSSQLPVGSVARLERLRPDLHFACSPENLRLGKAIAVFSDPDRVILGVRDEHTRLRLTELFAPITAKLEWMSVESAEMTKHAINAFLALSVTFANELASVCERVGADAKEVERGLKTESRIGPKAYLGPGGAFAGGTLARDIAFLAALGAERGLALPLISGVRPSNEAHKQWARRRLEDRLGSVAGKTVAVLGLTYKPGTDTLRRSASVELCRDLASAGAKVRAFDPAVKSIDLAFIELAPTAAAAIAGADALVIATEWPELAALDLAALATTMKRRLVVDANRFVAKQFAGSDTEYYAVGVPDRG
jgi:UDPglucose 6-dehydrogenase